MDTQSGSGSTAKQTLKLLAKNPRAQVSDADLDAALTYAEDAYYNKGKSIVSDAIYDILRERASSSRTHSRVGAPVGQGKKVDLPFYMGSMDKIKEDAGALGKWCSKYMGDAIISDKLDGISALFVYNATDGTKSLYTRGDGSVGQDISHLIPHITTLPRLSPQQQQQSQTIRGELIMSKADFEKVKDQGANARNMVAGLVNAKTPSTKLLKYVQFVAYSVMSPNVPGMGPEAQMQFMSQSGFVVVNWIKLPEAQLTFDNLSKHLVKRRAESDYECDGIIVAHNQPHKHVTGKNPAHAFAFKNVITQETAEVTVTGIEWNISKDGYFKPTVLVTPVKLAGVTIGRTTGFNAEYIQINRLGVGARVLLTRSGDVIPYIIQVLAPAESGEPDMPDEEYQWNETGKEIQVVGKNDEKEFKQFENFFVKLKVPGVATGTARKLWDGGINTIHKALTCTEKQLLSIPGFQAQSAHKVSTTLNGVKDSLTCVSLMEASNAFGRGFGERKLKTILKGLPEGSLSGTSTPTMDQLTAIEGIQTKSAEAFLEGLKQYRAFVKANKLDCEDSVGMAFTIKKVKSKTKSQSTESLQPISKKEKKVVKRSSSSSSLDSLNSKDSKQSSLSKKTKLRALKRTESSSSLDSLNSQKSKSKKVKKAATVPVPSLEGVHVIFSGVRNKEMEAFIEDNGGKVVTSTSKKLNMVITNDPDGKTAKVDFARTNGLTIMRPEEFAVTYRM